MGKPTVREGNAGENGEPWGWTETNYDFTDPEQLEQYCKDCNCTKEEALDPNRITGHSLYTTYLVPNRKAPQKEQG